MPRAVAAAVDARGYVSPLVQDTLLQTFGDIGFSREIDAHSDAYRRWLQHRPQQLVEPVAAPQASRPPPQGLTNRERLDTLTTGGPQAEGQDVAAGGGSVMDQPSGSETKLDASRWQRALPDSVARQRHSE